MLQANGIVMRYGPRTAVDNVDLDVRPGEILGLLGPNGAGKTTLLRRLAGLLPGSAGTVDLDGADPAVDPAARARIGYLPEDPPLYGDDIAFQYVAYLAGLSGVPRSKRKAAATDALQRVGADKLATGSSAACPRGSGSGWRWPGPSSTGPTSSCSTSRRKGSTPARWWRCEPCWAI